MSSARERIAKLRAVAARPGTPAEGATAARLADELEAKLPKARRRRSPPVPGPVPGVPFDRGVQFAAFVRLVSDVAAILEFAYTHDGKRVTRAKRRVRR